MNYAKELEFAKKLALEAGTIMRKYYRSSITDIQIKDDKTLVTAADTAINTLVIERVQKSFPHHNVHGEEESLHVENDSYTWVCDPVDGTQPFANGLPISTFSLALVDSNGHSVLGVVYDPYGDRLFEAVRGSGARVNGKKITASNQDTLDGAYIDQEVWINEVEGVSFDDPRDTFNKAGAKVTVLCSAVIMGCLVAEGTYDALIFGQSKPEDIAALSVIVEEAGGRVTSFVGADQRYDQKIYGAVVSNGYIHDQLIKVLKDINYVSKYVTP